MHPRRYLNALEALAAAGGGPIDPDTYMGPRSWEAVTASAGVALRAVTEAMRPGGGGTAFAATRPPGHHALASRAMGFCFVNNVVVAARHAQQLGAARVLIVDWDVHHGNGTQALVEQDASIRFVSMHQSPWYPGTGAADDSGYRLQRRYDYGYMQCMYAKGHKIPVSGRVTSSTPNPPAAYATPPSPSAPPRPERWMRRAWIWAGSSGHRRQEPSLRRL